MSEPFVVDSGPSPELIYALTEDRVQKTLEALVVAHRNGTLEPQTAMSGIATISALRLLPGDLARRIKQAK